MIIKALVGLLNLILKALGGIANIAVSILPPSPFSVLDTLSLPYIDVINWVIPVSFMVTVFNYWVGAIAIYYVVQVILRWVKIIE